MFYLLTRGQSIEVSSQILRKARSHKLLVPSIKIRVRRCQWLSPMPASPQQVFTAPMLSLRPQLIAKWADAVCTKSAAAQAPAAEARQAA